MIGWPFFSDNESGQEIFPKNLTFLSKFFGILNIFVYKIVKKNFTSIFFFFCFSTKNPKSGQTAKIRVKIGTFYWKSGQNRDASKVGTASEKSGLSRAKLRRWSPYIKMNINTLTVKKNAHEDAYLIIYTQCHS